MDESAADPLFIEAMAEFGRLFEAAGAAGEPDRTAMTVATATLDARPSARTVLLKGHDARSLNRYVLLDAQDWMTPAQLCALWTEIDRTAHETDARVIFRTAGGDSPLPRKLPPELQKLIDETTRPRIEAVGKLWDSADAPGKKYLESEGDNIVTLSAEQNALFKKIGAEDTANVLAALDKQGKPGTKVHAAMKAAAEKYAKTSFSFWKT